MVKLKKDSRDKKEIERSATIIEKTLDAFGIKTRVSEVNIEDDNVRYSLEIVIGTRIDDIFSLDKDLSLALATLKPVKIIAPEPGRSMISIIVPKIKNGSEVKNGLGYKIIQKQEKVIEYVTFDNVERLRRLCSFGLVLIAKGILWIADKIDTEYEVKFQKTKSGKTQ
ncbi:hypothetical protein A3E10_01000 [Candidatus Roizmanbacteria bacterium RIFCSPHIGHO2_12_FULL_37_23]|nr:MAG: hypothetical protein A3E10_01000 [Candidatus Roizmanbacteria bacterium RIFCSPHIGHO2_12_FULL_37_23]